MFGNIKFPYFNMQQLNLDWTMERISKTPEIIQLPALAGDDLSDVQDMIDLKALDIPKAICFINCGLHDDPQDRRCAVLLFKIDNDNMVGLVFGMSDNIDVTSIRKESGVWA
jgi:hypothetical protein